MLNRKKEVRFHPSDETARDLCVQSITAYTELHIGYVNSMAAVEEESSSK